MRKKLSILALTLISVFVLCSCGSGKEDQTYNGYTAADIQAVVQQSAEQLEQLSPEEAQQYETYYEADKDDEEAPIYAEMFKNWAENRGQAGEFKGYGDFTVTKSGKTITASQILDYSKRDMKLTYVMNAHDMEVTAINAELVYTMGETMSKAGLNVLMGISTVFVMLIIISLIISCFKFIPAIQAKFSGESAPEKKEAPKAQPRQAAPAAAPAAQASDDLELVAVIAAAIAASTGTSTDDFVVRSIKRRY